ncbi:helix-turn-helix domain-containing protein [Thermoanaerobacter mathranii]|uniref:helix-turn-helix domain-containing protein n=1 Tax=Thermoanaerobacter mathranii TaxID=583357 RepID=UPI003D6AFB33
MNRVVLSRIENGKSLPSLEQLIYIAEKLEVPVGYFFSDWKEKYHYSIFLSFSISLIIILCLSRRITPSLSN